VGARRAVPIVVKSPSALPRRPSGPAPALTLRPGARAAGVAPGPEGPGLALTVRPPRPGPALTVRPPRAGSASTTCPPESSGPRTQRRPPPPRGVLLVESDAVLRRALRLRLRAEGVTTAEAATASDATALLARQRFGLVVVDEQLPDESGIAWVAKLRASGDRVPVALVAGLCSDVRALAPAALGLDLRFIVEKREVLRTLPARTLAFFARPAPPAGPEQLPPDEGPTERPPGAGSGGATGA
jgi:CheY-like chemotaxis protein